MIAVWPHEIFMGYSDLEAEWKSSQPQICRSKTKSITRNKKNSTPHHSASTPESKILIEGKPNRQKSSNLNKQFDYKIISLLWCNERCRALTTLPLIWWSSAKVKCTLFWHKEFTCSFILKSYSNCWVLNFCTPPHAFYTFIYAICIYNANGLTR